MAEIKLGHVYTPTVTKHAMGTLLLTCVIIIGSLITSYATPNVGSEDEQPQKPNQ